MQEKIETITINNVEYVRKDQFKTSPVINTDGLKCCIVRARSAGVFYGFIEKKDGQEVTLVNARRMWQWYGASLSELAQDGTPDKTKCKFPQEVDRVIILEVIEILDLTTRAKASLDEVAIWKA